MTILSAERVEAVFMDSLIKSDEDKSQQLVIEGITTKVGFHPNRLASHREEIEVMLNELPEGFKKGWSFVMACDDKYGNQWTGFHLRMEQLFQLGLGIEKVELLTPREMWPVLPYGLPYYLVR